jgi:hypothetical protein
LWYGKPGYRAYVIPTNSMRFPVRLSQQWRRNVYGHLKEVRHRSLPGKSLGIAINDFDRDGWPDIFVANDSVMTTLPQQS